MKAGRREGAAPRCHIVISIVSGKVWREMEIEARKKT